jgi:hypothetical protein
MKLQKLFTIEYKIIERKVLHRENQIKRNLFRKESRGDEMLFQVDKTSEWTNKKPYDKCIPIQLTRVETYFLRTPEEFDKRFSDRKGKWLNVGTNHRINKQGYITRNLDVDAWGVEINTLEELLKFKDEVNKEIVLKKSWIDKKTPCLEIYDTRREW